MVFYLGEGSLSPETQRPDAPTTKFAALVIILFRSILSVPYLTAGFACTLGGVLMVWPETSPAKLRLQGLRRLAAAWAGPLRFHFRNQVSRTERDGYAVFTGVKIPRCYIDSR